MYFGLGVSEKQLALPTPQSENSLKKRHWIKLVVVLRNTLAENHPGTDRVETEDGVLVLVASAPAAHNAGLMTAAAPTPDSLSVTPTAITTTSPVKCLMPELLPFSKPFSAVSTVRLFRVAEVVKV